MLFSNRRVVLCCTLITALALVPLAASVPPPDVIDTPQKVWQGYDPRQEPLEAEVTKKWTEEGAEYREMYFTGMSHEGEKVRVYGIYSAPQGGKKLPGMLHIHGGGQTVSLRWAKFWNERGYAFFTFNWGGKWAGRDKYTLWGPLKQGNHGEVKELLHATEPSVRSSSWYLWARISRRALTCLEQQPEVDADRLGIFGVSMGGSLVWPVAGSDQRVKAACAVYGVGWNTYPADVAAPDPKGSDPKTKLWRAAMEPESYAPLVKCPILFLSGTNDHHGKMDWAYRTLDAVPAEHRQAFSPHWRHHVAPAQGKDLPLWMDAWLKNGPAWPKTPAVKFDLEGGVPRLTVEPDASRQIKRVDCYYAVENRNPVNRFWRTVPSQQNGTTWTASLPILNVSQPLFAFANVHYESGVCLSSPLLSTIAAKLGDVKATDVSSLLIDDFRDGIIDWHTRSPGTDPVGGDVASLMLAKGPDGKNGVASVKHAPLHTTKLGDPKWRGPGGAQFQFQVHVRSPRTLEITMGVREFTKNARAYVATIKLQPADGWQTITLPSKAFKTAAKGQTLPSWRDVQILKLDAGGGPGAAPIFTDFRWVEPMSPGGKGSM